MISHIRTYSHAFARDGRCATTSHINDTIRICWWKKSDVETLLWWHVVCNSIKSTAWPRESILVRFDYNDSLVYEYSVACETNQILLYEFPSINILTTDFGWHTQTLFSHLFQLNYRSIFAKAASITTI